MAASEILRIENNLQNEDVLISITPTYIIIQNTAADATHFCANIPIDDWNKIKTFIDRKINE